MTTADVVSMSWNVTVRSDASLLRKQWQHILNWTLPTYNILYETKNNYETKNVFRWTLKYIYLEYYYNDHISNLNICQFHEQLLDFRW